MVFVITGYLGFLADELIDGNHAGMENGMGPRYFDFPLGFAHWLAAVVVFTWRSRPFDGSRFADYTSSVPISFYYPHAFYGKNEVVLDAFNMDYFLDAIIGQLVRAFSRAFWESIEYMLLVWHLYKSGKRKTN